MPVHKCGGTSSMMMGDATCSALAVFRSPLLKASANCLIVASTAASLACAIDARPKKTNPVSAKESFMISLPRKGAAPGGRPGVARFNRIPVLLSVDRERAGSRRRQQQEDEAVAYRLAAAIQDRKRASGEMADEKSERHFARGDESG